jgi:glutaredoxin
VRGFVQAARERAAATAAADEAEPQNRVRLYTTSWCPHCKRAKQWLTAQHVDYVELDVESNAWARREHRKLSPRGTIPTLDADGAVVIGFSPEQFQQALRRGGAQR